MVVVVVVVVVGVIVLETGVPARPMKPPPVVEFASKLSYRRKVEFRVALASQFEEATTEPEITVIGLFAYNSMGTPTLVRLARDPTVLEAGL